MAYSGAEFPTFAYSATPLPLHEHMPLLKEALLERGRRLKTKTSDVLAAADEPSRFVFLCCDGRYKIQRALRDGRSHVLGFAGPGDIFGNPFSEKTLGCSLVSLIDGEVIRISFDSFLEECANNPVLCSAILFCAAEEIDRRSAQLVMLSRKTAEERVAYFLIEMLDHSRVQFGAMQTSLRLNLDMPRRDIADYLGLTLETVSRTLSTLRQRKLINIQAAKEVEIADEAALASLAGDEAQSFRAPRLFF